MIRVAIILLAIGHFATGIYKGVPVTDETEFGFTVQVQHSQYYNNEWPQFTCGGAIVSPNVVLTAAHCIELLSDKVKSNSGHRMVLKAIAGETRLDHQGPTAQVRLAKQIIIHERYNDSKDHYLYNDVALLVLTHPWEFNQFVYPIDLPEQDQVFNGNGSIAGWGLTEHGLPSDVLLKAQMRILSSEQCDENINEYSRKYGSPETIAELDNEVDSEEEPEPGTSICGEGYDGAGLCPGDSGSPIACQVGNQRILCGVESWGLPEHCEGKGPPGPEVFVAVANVSDWIHATISEHTTSCEAGIQFDCGDGTCVPSAARCDRKVDCGLGTDETNCEPCGAAQFLCNGKFKCIDAAYVCDGTNDCGNDASDELGCGNCTVDQFQCASGGSCIDKGLACDGVKHCPDGSDEIGCSQCTGFEFQCKNKKCIHKDRICDGHNTCLDASDELACPNCPVQSYGPNCTDVLVFDDHPNLTCDRTLDFAACILRFCSFNKETRECFPRTSFVHLWNESAEVGDSTITVKWQDLGQMDEHWSVFGFAGIGVAAVGALFGYCAIRGAQNVAKWWRCRQRTGQMKPMTFGCLGSGTPDEEHQNTENASEIENV